MTLRLIAGPPATDIRVSCASSDELPIVLERFYGSQLELCSA
jgi:hypothetical protein